MRHLIALLLLLAAGLGLAHGADEPVPDHFAKAKELIDLTMPPAKQVQVVDGMIEQMRSNAAMALPEEFFRRFKARWPAAELRDLAIRTHMKCYTVEEIVGLIDFYKTPLGRKVITTTPELMQMIMKESMMMGQRLGAEIMQEIQAEKGAGAPAPR